MEGTAGSGLEAGETASVFTYYPGERLFVMARTGLSQVLYNSRLQPTTVRAAVDSGFADVYTYFNCNISERKHLSRSLTILDGGGCFLLCMRK